MKKNFAVFVLTLLYMELIYHFAGFGWSGINPVLLIPACIFLAGMQTLVAGFLRVKVNKVILWVMLGIDYLLFASQLVYMKIFKQPLLFAAVTNAGKQAVTNYWREALQAVLMASGYLLLLAVPLAVTGLLLKFNKLSVKSHSLNGRIGAVTAMTSGAAAFVLLLFIGFKGTKEYYEDYLEFYDPGMNIEQYGVLASVQRDMMSGILKRESIGLEVWQDNVMETGTAEGTQGEKPENVTDNTASEESDAAEEIQKPDTSPHVLPIDFAKLSELADTENVAKLAAYMQTMQPTNRNEYTGMFEGYNLIYLTAEGFSPYAVDETVTPTLYKLVNSGFVFQDYYVPLWQTSTSDGEYVNCTGLIPDQQFSFKRSADIEMPFTLPRFFEKEGVKSYAYHNNTLSYYERYRTHPNLGYDFKASKLGELSAEEWSSQIFPMENADFWPASDLDMMKGTIPEYLNDERFHVYYMTVSGHMNYNFKGNRMSSINKEAVAELPYSEESRAYIACHVELDKALAYLIEQLEAAGKLENTVICLSTDHYPYGMTMPSLEELAGKPLEGTLEIYRNNLILWNSQMETVQVTKPSSAIDIMPTLLNLFGFDFDSRLYAGTDILSDSEPLVIFSDRSFINERIIYNKKTKSVESRTEEPVDDAYVTAMKQKVKSVYEYSAGILNHDFYRYVKQALTEEMQIP